MYHILELEIDAMDVVTGKFYYNDRSPVFLTVNPFQATVLTDNEIEEVKNNIKEKVKTLLDLLTDENGMFNKLARIVVMTPEYRLPLLIISTTISKLLEMGVKTDFEACESSFILETTELNDYWIKKESPIIISPSLSDIVLNGIKDLSFDFNIMET